MKMKKIVSIFLIAIISIIMLTMVLGSVQAVHAKSKVKIIYNGNGGKIGNSKTKIVIINKGDKIGKLPQVHARTGYKFKGWYTKKSGGSKISKNTKLQKSTTLYAHWEEHFSFEGEWKSVEYNANTIQTITFANVNFISEEIIYSSVDDNTIFRFKGTFKVVKNVAIIYPHTLETYEYCREEDVFKWTSQSFNGEFPVVGKIINGKEYITGFFYEGILERK